MRIRRKDKLKDLKEKVRKIVQQRNLCSCMNATKWKELRNAMMDEMPFPPPFIIKYLDTECIEEADFQNDVWHWGDWYYAYAVEGSSFDASFAVEWIKVRPRYLKSRGALIEPEIISAEDIFVVLLKKYGIPYEENDGVYCIYGYR